MKTGGHRPEVAIIRQTLERSLPATVTSAVLFEALDRFGKEVPRTAKDFRRLVDGPLAQTLEERIGARKSVGILQQIRGELDHQPDPEIIIDYVEDDDDGSVVRVKEEEATRVMATFREAVSVWVVAAGSGFSARLFTALGPRDVAPRTIRRPENLLTGEPPPIVLVDATDFPSIEPQALADAFAEMPQDTARVVWAVGLPYGRGVAKALQEANIPHITLRRSDGIEPLLDIIRSRKDPNAT